MARLCNDEIKHPNSVMKKVVDDGRVYLCLFALRDLTAGDEVRYDYGPDKHGSMPWRKVSVLYYFSPLTRAATHGKQVACPRGWTGPYLGPVDTIASFCTPTIAQALTDAPLPATRMQEAGFCGALLINSVKHS